jgi:filamin
MTYISYFRDYDSDNARRKREAEEAERLRKMRTADPSQCYAYGPGLESGATNNDCPFTIQAVNYFGDNLPTGGDQFNISISGPDTPKASCVDNSNGTYSCKYVPKAAGDYKVAINLRNEPIKGSPYGPVKIVGPSSQQCYATGPGVEGGRVGPSVPFKIHSVDQKGTPVRTGSDPFKAAVKGPGGNSVPCQLKDNGDGTYDGAYAADKPGRYEVAITLDNNHIKNSPYTPLLEAANAGQSWAEGPGLTEGKTGKPCPFTIHAVDSDGQNLNKGGDPFVVNISGPQNVSPKITDNKDGTYDVVYQVDKPGDYKLDVTLHGGHIRDSPFHPHIKASGAAGKSYAEGPGLESPKDNEPAVFTIHSVDKDGKPRTDGGDDFKVDISGTEKLVPKIVDNDDGTYTVTYNPDKPGPYVVKVTLDDDNIKDSPFKVNVAQGIDHDNTSFGIFSFTVQTKDKRGELRTVGGDNFEVSFTGPAPVDVKTSDNGDGSYTASYLLEERGTYKGSVKLNGKHIKGSPFSTSF